MKTYTFNVKVNAVAEVRADTLNAALELVKANEEGVVRFTEVTVMGRPALATINGETV